MHGGQIWPFNCYLPYYIIITMVYARRTITLRSCHKGGIRGNLIKPDNSYQRTIVVTAPYYNLSIKRQKNKILHQLISP
jgi:hypothetical protein